MQSDNPTQRAGGVMSRRRFVGTAAAGAVVGGWLWVPLLSHAQTNPPTNPPAPVLPGAPSPTPTPSPTPKPAQVVAPAGQGGRLFLEFPDPAPIPGGSLRLVGESADANHPNTIELASVALGLQDPAVISSGPGGASKTRFEALRLVKPIDLASSPLLLALGRGARFPQANLYLSAGGPERVYSFKGVVITQIVTQTGDEGLVEAVDFVFGAMQVTLPGPSSQGVAAWSVVDNQPTFSVGP